MSWLDNYSTTNTFRSMYINGFIDISGGRLQTRSVTDGHLFIAGDTSLNGNLYVGGDISWNPNNLADNSIPSSAIIGGVGSSTGLTRFIYGNLAYTAYNNYESLGLLFGGPTGSASAYTIPYNLSDPTAGTPLTNQRNFTWSNNSYKVKVCRPSHRNDYIGVVLTPGVWNIKFNVSEIQPSTATLSVTFFIDNTNNLSFTDSAGGGRNQQQKRTYSILRLSSDYAVPQMDLTVYVGAPGIPEVNSGYAKILGIYASINFKPLTSYGGWSIDCTQLEAFTWNGLYNGWTPSTGPTQVGGSYDTGAGSWNRMINCN